MGNRLLTASLCIIAVACAVTPRSAARKPANVIAADLTFRNIAPSTWVITHEKPAPANSLVYRTGGNHIVLVGTPYTPEATETLVNWIRDTFGVDKPVTAINPHFHADAAGGNAALLRAGIPVYGSDLTAQLIRERGQGTPPDRVFPVTETQTLSLGGETVEIFYPGPAHSPDNIVVWFPSARLLFGGCLVRADRTLGNTADADLARWPEAIRRVERRYDARLIIPGHGVNFSPDMLRETEAALAAAK